MAELRGVGRPLVTVRLQHDADVVAARQRARTVAGLLGFDAQDQTRVATAVSELARNAFRYAGGGQVEMGVDPAARSMRVRVVDRGPGIADLAAVLEGRYASATGMGIGLAGTRRVMDEFRVESAPGAGTAVTVGKRLPADTRVDAPRLAEIGEALAREAPGDAYAEVQRQNREVLVALDVLREREQELLRLNRELEDTNRGVVALYKELDESVEQLRRSNAARAQFLSYMSHEFRTPLDSMIALTGLLLDGADGDLNDEQRRQMKYVQGSARDLLAMVDDLLDTARVDAGQAAVHPGGFTVAELFRAINATLRPLLVRDAVELVFETPDDTLPPLHTDEAKVSQILRNLVSNALKFTERGEIRVRARGEGGAVAFSVSDTGMGIPDEDQTRIFRDFAQVESPTQRRVKGTGLGLPLSRRLAELLGGRLEVESRPGEGSTFTLTLPVRYRPPEATEPEA